MEIYPDINPCAQLVSCIKCRNVTCIPSNVTVGDALSASDISLTLHGTNTQTPMSITPCDMSNEIKEKNVVTSHVHLVGFLEKKS